MGDEILLVSREAPISFPLRAFFEVWPSLVSLARLDENGKQVLELKEYFSRRTAEALLRFVKFPEFRRAWSPVGVEWVDLKLLQELVLALQDREKDNEHFALLQTGIYKGISEVQSLFIGLQLPSTGLEDTDTPSAIAMMPESSECPDISYPPSAPHQMAGSTGLVITPVTACVQEVALSSTLLSSRSTGRKRDDTSRERKTHRVKQLNQSDALIRRRLRRQIARRERREAKAKTMTYENGSWTEEVMLAAIAEIKEGAVSIRQAADKYNIPPTSIRNWLHGKSKSKKRGPPCQLKDDSKDSSKEGEVLLSSISA